MPVVGQAVTGDDPEEELQLQRGVEMYLTQMNTSQRAKCQHRMI